MNHNIDFLLLNVPEGLDLRGMALESSEYKQAE